ncbi:MAG TPA: hypothetical protein VHS09_13515, partial [Polyangiaceae bacterium]|nr:hypothetical protein [Polyangiaceae bacterium]
TMGLRGGSRLELEVVTPDGSPLRFEVWRARSNGSVTLEMPVDAPSGFALEDLAPFEDGTWVVAFPALSRGDVLVHSECVGGLRGCTETRQPGETCPPGFPCDEGLLCELPAGLADPLAIGTCVPRTGS